jgi:hypothetical protein
MLSRHEQPPGNYLVLEIAESVSNIERATLLLASGIIDCASENSENSFQWPYRYGFLDKVSPRTTQQSRP